MISVVNFTLQSTLKNLAKTVFLFSLFFVLACSEQAPESFKLAGFTMGTSYNITVVGSHSLEQQAALKTAVDTRLEELNDLMSTYIDYSELSIVNKLPARKSYEVSPELFDLLALSLEISWLSNGAFDITVGALVDLWGFGPTDRGDTPPSTEAVAELLAKLGYKNLELNFADTELLKRTDLSLDLSAIGKGYGVDEVAELLIASGVESFMVEIGGEIRTLGQSPRNSPWRIAVEKPGADIGMVQQILTLDDSAVATSGDYRNYFEKDGLRYSHTIDPRTGYPITHNLASVTVITDSAAYADALATAITVLGAEQGLKLAQQQGIAVYLLLKTDEGFEVKTSDAFERYLN
jgi:thiamine biosynthesis lipoprotein